MATNPERQAESSRLSDDQVRRSLEFLREALPGLVSNSHQMSESERGLVENLADSMVGNQSWRALAVQTAYLTKRSMELRAALVILVELTRHFEGSGKALLGLHVAVQGQKIGSLEKELQEVQEQFTTQGRRGGLKRHAKTRELKEWIASESVGMQGSDKAIARELIRRIPNELHDVSSDPERFIYEKLRELKRNG